MPENWIILGATSSMARAFGRAVAAQGARVFLAGRDIDDLAASASDCALRGAPMAEAVRFDARDPDGFTTIIDTVSAQDGLINVAVFVGSMPEQAEIDADPSLIAGLVTDNYAGPAAFLQAIACLLYTSPSPRDRTRSRMPSSA